MLEQQTKARKAGAGTADMVRARKPAEPLGAGRLFAAQVDEVTALRASRRPQSSRHSFGGRHEFRMLPPLTSDEHSDAERRDLLAQKLVQCTTVFDFQNPNENIDGKEAKQRTLGEILDYISERTDVITLDMYPKLFKMVSANLFRTIPPQINAFGDPFDPEEDEPREEPAWPHLCLVYHIFLRFLESGDFNNSAARPYIDQTFITQLLDLFDCEDVRERESLKTVLHRIYGKMLGMRSFIRRSINNIFLQFIYETQRHNGIAELLEILGSIINGFTVPLKDEHIGFLHRVLLPLHKARPMGLYYAQLTYCTVQFLEKDPKLADTIIRALLRYWPKVNSPKEVMFVNEIEGIMDVIEPAQFTAICQPLFQQLVRCIVSPHFQIAERTLGMWRNNYFVNLITDNIRLVLPIALSGIYRHSRSHWNRNIHNQVYQILRFFVTVDEPLFEQCLADFRRQRDLERRRSKKSVGWWSAIERLAMEKASRDAATPAANDGSVLSSVTASKAPSLSPPLQPDAITTTTAAATISLAGSAPMDTGDGEAGAATAGAGSSPAPNEQPGEQRHEQTSEQQPHEGEEGEEGEENDGAPIDSWSEHGGDLPMSKLDDPEMMCCEMDEDEFIQELDKFVDIIRSEDPAAAQANGNMLFDESDGPSASDDMLGPGLHNPYGYGQQQGQYSQQHEMLIHGMMADGMMVAGDGGPHMVMDPSSMHIDYAAGPMAVSDGQHSIASTLARPGMGGVAAYPGHPRHYGAPGSGGNSNNGGGEEEEKEGGAGLDLVPDYGSAMFCDPAASAPMSSSTSSGSSSAASELRAAAAISLPVPADASVLASAAEARGAMLEGADMEPATPPSSTPV